MRTHLHLGRASLACAASATEKAAPASQKRPSRPLTPCQPPATGLPLQPSPSKPRRREGGHKNSIVPYPAKPRRRNLPPPSTPSGAEHSSSSGRGGSGGRGSAPIQLKRPAPWRVRRLDTQPKPALKGSGQAAHSAIRAASSTQEVVGIVQLLEEDGILQAFSLDVALDVAINRLKQLALSRRPESSSSASTSAPLQPTDAAAFAALCHIIARHLPCCDDRTVCSLARACRELGTVPPPEHHEALVEAFLSRMSDANEKSLGLFMHAVGVQPGWQLTAGQLQRMVRHAALRAKDDPRFFTAQGVSNLLCGVARCCDRVPGGREALQKLAREGVLQPLLRNMLATLGECTEQTCATNVLSLGLLGLNPPMSLLKPTLRMLATASSEDSFTLAHCAAAALSGLSKVVEASKASTAPSTLDSRLLPLLPPLLSKVVAGCEGALARGPSAWALQLDNLAMAFTALATLRFQPGSKAWEALLRPVLQHPQQLSAAKACQLLLPVAVLGLRGPLEEEFVALARQRVEEELSMLTFEEAALACYALAILQALPHNLLLATVEKGQAAGALDSPRTAPVAWSQIHYCRMLLEAEPGGAEAWPRPLPAVMQRIAQWWREELADVDSVRQRTHTAFQWEVLAVLQCLGESCILEHPTADGMVRIDIAIPAKGIAVEVDGPTHCTVNDGGRPTGREAARNRLLQARGWRVVEVPLREWQACGGDLQSELGYMMGKLGAVGQGP